MGEEKKTPHACCHPFEENESGMENKLAAIYHTVHSSFLCFVSSLITQRKDMSSMVRHPKGCANPGSANKQVKALAVQDKVHCHIAL